MLLGLGVTMQTNQSDYERHLKSIAAMRQTLWNDLTYVLSRDEVERIYATQALLTDLNGFWLDKLEEDNG